MRTTLAASLLLATLCTPAMAQQGYYRPIVLPGRPIIGEAMAASIKESRPLIFERIKAALSKGGVIDSFVKSKTHTLEED